MKIGEKLCVPFVAGQFMGQIPYDVCATIINWSEKEKDLYTWLFCLDEQQKVAWKCFMIYYAIEELFAVPNHTKIYRVQFEERKERASNRGINCLIRRLACLAYPTTYK